MTGNAALNEVVRVLGTELGNDDHRIIIGSTQSEKDILEKQAAIGKRRAVIGFGTGAAISGGVVRFLGGGQRRLLGGVAMAGGAMVGVMYGLLSIRHDLFYEILSLPADRSPFAVQARKILDQQLPQNAFYLKVKEKLKELERTSGSWDAAPAFPLLKEPGEDMAAGFRGLGETTSMTAKLPSLPSTSSQTDDAIDTPNEAPPSSSVFFFGQAPPSSPTTPRPALPTQAQDDSAWYDDDNQHQEESKPKPTSWEEIRRRAASSRG